MELVFNIGDLKSMNYLSPVYVTIGAAIFLGEKLAMRRIVAILIALLGAAIILRPGFREVSSGHLAMLVTAIVFAGSYLTAKIMAGEVKPTVVVAMLSIFVPIGLAPFAIAVWVTPSLNELMLFRETRSGFVRETRAPCRDVATGARHPWSAKS